MMSRTIHRRCLRILAFGMLIAAAAILRPASARASDVGFRVGYLFDAEAFSMGIGILTSLDGRNEWFFNPNFEVAVGDERNVAALNGDFHYDFDTRSDAAVWVGGGPALLITDHERPDRDNDVDPALNLLLGIGAKTGSYRPFAQIKGVLSDNSDAALSVGIRF